LEIEERGKGRYRILYTISEDNIAQPGVKNVRVNAVDFPSVLDMEDMESVVTHALIGLTYPDDLNIVFWDMLIDPFDNDPINLDNQSPNFDFAMIDPFGTPNAKWTDDGAGAGTPDDGIINGTEYETVNYVYGVGDRVRVFVQLDPHDLTIDELEEVDVEEWGIDGVEDLEVGGVDVIGDISALLDPSVVNLTSDVNGNGIPDVAEVVAEYAGGNGDDDDFDGLDDDTEDEEDSTVNGFNERFIWVIEFTIDDKFKGASGQSDTLQRLEGSLR
jgi:hypothetical protein